MSLRSLGRRSVSRIESSLFEFIFSERTFSIHVECESARGAFHLIGRAHRVYYRRLTRNARTVCLVGSPLVEFRRLTLPLGSLVSDAIIIASIEPSRACARNSIALFTNTTKLPG